jgi:hypothetical protein
MSVLITKLKVPKGRSLQDERNTGNESQRGRSP